MNKSELISLEVEETADGSPTLYLPNIDEHYHSVYGARTESQHVFVKHGLLRYLAEEPSCELTVLEVGFGTGLNALLTLLACPESCTITYHTYERYPLSKAMVSSLFEQKLSAEEWKVMQQLHDAPWGEPYQIQEGFFLHKHHQNICTAALPAAEVLYMDAFAPEKTPELWSDEMIQKLATATVCRGRLSTYCAKGVVRRSLEEKGFRVERVQGPPGGKREILTCKKTR